MKISIITAVYNSEHTIACAIDSVAAQRNVDLEHIVIEGASTDRSLDAINRARHQNMHVFSEPDSGIYDALNKGISKASGDIIGIVHSDDFLAHDLVLNRVAAAFSDPTIEAAYGDLDYVSKDDIGRIIRRWIAGEYSKRRLARGWMPPHPTLFLRRAVFDRIGNYDTGFRIAADYDFVLRYFSKVSANPVYIPEVLVKMRLGGESNRNALKVLRKSYEDYIALRNNDVGGLWALAAKNVSKIPQFIFR